MKKNTNNFKDLYEQTNQILDMYSAKDGEDESMDEGTKHANEIEDIEDMSLIDHDYQADISEVLRYSDNNDIRD